MPGRRMRGSTLNGYLNFVKTKWGSGGLEACRTAAGITIELREGAFYPDENLIGILKWIRGKKGDEGVIDAGRYIVANLGLIRFIVRYASPNLIINSFSKNYKEIYNVGRCETDTSQKNRATMRFYDTYAGEERCLVWIGICQGAMELTRHKGTVRETKCVSRGDPCCEYTLDWTD